MTCCTIISWSQSDAQTPHPYKEKGYGYSTYPSDVPTWCVECSVKLMWNHGEIRAKNKLYNQSTKEVLDEEKVIWYERRSDTVELH